MFPSVGSLWQLAPLIALAFVGCAAPTRAPRTIDALAKAPIHTFTDQELDTYLHNLFLQKLTLQDRVRLLARQSIGQPYKLGPLGEYPFELTDPDPLVCLAASDCVTFVEQTYAMALADDWPSFARQLIRLRYRNSIIGFEDRNHFVEADWNPANNWLFDEVSRPISRGSTVTMNTQIDRAAFFAKHGIHKQIAIRDCAGIYIPTAKLGQCLDQIKDADIVELVKGNDKLQYVSHMGLLFHDAAGRVTMLHAGKPAVHELPLEDYLAAHPTVLGIKVLRPRQQTLPLP
ncbi:MAG: DUF1460 domain-containing protein [Planctomycetes bacterium]|nr:DUF1460 domain-containing protein [Planctomycetota bacterium]